VGEDVVNAEILEPLRKSKLEVTKSVVGDDDESDDEVSGDEESDGEESDGDASDEGSLDSEGDFADTLEGLGSLEKWLHEAHGKLHPNHVWILEMEFQLVVAYSRLAEDLGQESILRVSVSATQVFGQIVISELQTKIHPKTTNKNYQAMRKSMIRHLHLYTYYIRPRKKS
jgi:hypothetical protein